MEYYEAIGMNPENNPTGLPGLKDTRPKAIRAPRAPPKSELFKDAPQLPLTPLKVSCQYYYYLILKIHQFFYG